MATSYTPNLANSRYTDFRDEPVSRLLAPISGYQDMPQVSLEESVEPVAELFDEINSCIWVSKENCKNPADGLTLDESAAIHLYTMQFGTNPSLYHALNEKLRSENRQSLKPWFSYLKLFLTALHKLPSHSQTVWRGVRDVDLSSKYPTGTKFAWWCVSSCTINMEVLESENFLGKTGLRTLFSIECQNGKYIAPHSYFKDKEKEMVLMPGSYFEVVGQLHPAKDLHIIHVKEIQPPFPLVKPPFKKESSSNPPIKKINDNTNAKPTPPPVPQKVVPPPAPKIVPPSPPATQKKAKYCGGNACSKCGLCIDWSYDGDLARDYDLWINDKSDDVRDGNRWHRSPHATCDRYADHADHDYDYYRYHAAHHAHHALCKCPR